MTLIQTDDCQLIEFTQEKEKPMTNELPIMQQPLVAPATPEQQLVAATLPPTANQPAPGAKMPERAEKVEFDLPDGRHVIIRRGKGRDLVNAMRIASDEVEQTMVVAAACSTIDGEAIHHQDFLDMDMADCFAITRAYNTLMGN